MSNYYNVSVNLFNTTTERRHTAWYAYDSLANRYYLTIVKSGAHPFRKYPTTKELQNPLYVRESERILKGSLKRYLIKIIQVEERITDRLCTNCEHHFRWDKLDVFVKEEIHCIQNFNKDFPVYNEYDKKDAFLRAETCPHYFEGYAIVRLKHRSHPKILPHKIVLWMRKNGHERYALECLKKEREESNGTNNINS